MPKPIAGYPLSMPEVFAPPALFMGGDTYMTKPLPPLSTAKWCGDLMSYGGVKSIRVATITVIVVRGN